MATVRLRELCSTIRSKQAGPFRLTFDLLFKTPDLYGRVKAAGAISAWTIAEAYGVPPSQVTNFVFYDPGHAVKVTLVRPCASGDLGDGDIYGCQQHAPLLDLQIDLGGAHEGPGQGTVEDRP